jgi:hypothetical protein
MILSNQVVILIADELSSNSITGFNALAPEEQTYPFVVYTVRGLTNRYSFQNEYEDVLVRFEIHTNSTDVQDVIDIMVDLETIWNFNSYPFIAPDVGQVNICAHKVTESLTKTEEAFCLGTVDYVFQCWRPK